MLKLVRYPDPILTTKAELIPYMEELPVLVEEMFQIMKDNHGIGLAAPQIGLSYRLFVLQMPESDNRVVVVDPKIIKVGQRMMVHPEGCLSLPGICVEVERPRQIQVEFLNETGKIVKYNYAGLMARAFLHENDHLDGKLIIDYKDTYRDRIN